jgi:hypothetical protein
VSFLTYPSPWQEHNGYDHETAKGTTTYSRLHFSRHGFQGDRMKTGTNNPGGKKTLSPLPIIAMIGTLGVFQPALALDRTWLGPGYLDVAPHWSPAGPAGPGDRATINGDVSILFNTRAEPEFTVGELGGKGNLTRNRTAGRLERWRLHWQRHLSIRGSSLPIWQLDQGYRTGEGYRRERYHVG